MKIALLAILLLAGLVSVAQAQAPADIYYNDFESANMATVDVNTLQFVSPGGQPNQPPGKCRFTDGTGVCTGMNGNLGGAMQTITDPANCHNGSSKCFRATIAAGGGAAWNGAAAEFGYSRIGGTAIRTIGCDGYGQGSTCYQNMFYRYWVRWTANFVLNVIVPAEGCQGKMMYVRSTTWPTGFNTLLVVFRSQGSVTGGRIDLSFENDNPGGVSSSAFSVFPDNQWHEIEVQTDIANSRARLWWDSVLKLDVAAPLSALVHGSDYELFGMYSNNPGNGACTSLNASTMWLDDMAVSTQRIGGGAPPPVIPNAPTSLRLISWLQQIWAWLVVGPRYA